MIVVDNGLKKRPLTDAETEALGAALYAAKKEKIKALENANALSNQTLTDADFGIPVLDELIKLFSGI